MRDGACRKWCQEPMRATAGWDASRRDPLNADAMKSELQVWHLFQHSLILCLNQKYPGRRILFTTGHHLGGTHTTMMSIDESVPKRLQFSIAVFETTLAYVVANQFLVPLSWAYQPVHSQSGVHARGDDDTRLKETERRCAERRGRRASVRIGAMCSVAGRRVWRRTTACQRDTLLFD